MSFQKSSALPQSKLNERLVPHLERDAAMSETDTEMCSPEEQVALPDWGMCQLKVSNEAYRLKHGYAHEVTCEADKTPTALERFLYEYEDADPVRNEQFLAMLRAVLVEARNHGK